jgi:hypothetical protein
MQTCSIYAPCSDTYILFALAENTCTVLGKDMPDYMQRVEVGGLVQKLRSFQTQPPSVAPMPALNSSSVEEPPLPPAAPRNVPDVGPSVGATPTPGGTPPSDAHQTATASTGMLLVMVSAALLI